MLQITETEIKKRLAFDNPWWEKGGIDDEVTKWPRRAYFAGFMRLVQQTAVNRAIVLMGPRRVGKTIMLTHAVQKLIDDGVEPKHIFYVAVDTPTYTGIPLERLLRWFMEMHGHERSNSLFVIFDEIQYHPDWERHLKSLVDSFPAMRFVVSGSAAAALKVKSDESGAGRFTDFLLPPLNFAEYLEFAGIENPVRTDVHATVEVAKLNEDLIDYLNFGAFPEAVLKPDVRASMDRFVANDIVDKVLLRDLPSLYGIADTQELKRFFTVLAYNTGMEVSFEGLAQASGVAKNTIRKYLDYLDAAFLIQRLYRLDQDGRRFKRVTHFKVYLTNPSIRSALFGPVAADDKAMPFLAETVVVSHLAQIGYASTHYYARWKDGEVDLVEVSLGDKIGLRASEVKWNDRFVTRPKEEIGSLLYFCEKNKITEAMVYSRGSEGYLDYGDIRILYGPVCHACLIFAWQAQEFYKDGVDPKQFSGGLKRIADFVTDPKRVRNSMHS
jgi:predicted AAA+ superfamily ATPase